VNAGSREENASKKGAFQLGGQAFFLPRRAVPGIRCERFQAVADAPFGPPQ
jgi:hypothetical protein